MDEKKLLKYAVDYLSKYDSSKNNLVNVIKRKILRLNVTNFEKKKLIDIIRNDIKFSGLLISDEISMAALPGDIKKRTTNLIEAGNDVILHCNAKLFEMKEIIESGVVPNTLTLSRISSVIEERKKIEHNKIENLESSQSS